MRSPRWLEKFGRIIWNMKNLHNPGWTPYIWSEVMNRMFSISHDYLAYLDYKFVRYILQISNKIIL